MAPAAAAELTSLTHVTAFINGKGGVGKTTLCANISGMLAGSQWRVLVVDMDPQGNMAIELGYRGSEDDDDGKALAASLLFGYPLKPIANVRKNLDVVAGGSFLNRAEQFLQNQTDNDTRLALARALAPIAGDYDLIAIDCPPGNRGLQLTAAAAARFLFIPTKTDEGGLNGLKITAGIIGEVADINPNVELLGVVIFGSLASAKNVRREYRNDVASSLGVDVDSEVIFTSFVREADSTAYWARRGGLLAHELEEKVAKRPKWWELKRAGKQAVNDGPASATTVADDMAAIVDEFTARFSALSEGEQR